MGRELRRKQAKKQGKSLQKEQLEEQNLIKRLIIIILVLVFIGCMIYILSALFVTKELQWFGMNSTKDTTKEESKDTVDNSILANAIFKQSETLYYVYFYDFDNEAEDKKLDEITDMVNGTLSSYKVYKVDTGSALNSKYIADKGNRSAKALDDLKVVSPTLIKIDSDKIVEYYEGEEIISKLG